MDKIKEENVRSSEIDWDLIEKIDYNDKDKYFLHCLDMTISLETRMNLLSKLSADDTMNVVQQLISIWVFSKSKLIEDYLLEISKHSKSMQLGFECLRTLCENDLSKAFQQLDKICQDVSLFAHSSVFLKIDAYTLLMKNKKYKKNGIKYFIYFLENSEKIEPRFKYKTILSLEKLGIDIHDFIDVFFNQNCTPNELKILCCQYMIYKKSLNNDLKKYIDFLISFCENQ